MLQKVPLSVISSHAPSLSLSDLSFALDPTDQKQVTNLTRILGILIVEEACILVTSWMGKNQLYLIVFNFILSSSDTFVVLFLKWW